MFVTQSPYKTLLTSIKRYFLLCWFTLIFCKLDHIKISPLHTRPLFYGFLRSAFRDAVPVYILDEEFEAGLWSAVI